MTPRVITDPAEMQRTVLELRAQGVRVGLVPTMGALHAGHISLVARGKATCDRVITTIFVNPTQFAPHEDFGKYPRTLAADLELLAAADCDFVFAPTNEAMYPAGCSTFVDPPAVAAPLEGVCRPGHFRGVATVVLKLFGIVPAQRAFFGQKDFQQAAVIRRMVADLNVPIAVEVCPIVREADGLAMSSRNRYLSPPQRQQATALFQALERVRKLVAGGERQIATLEAVLRETLSAAGIERQQYAVIRDRDTLAELATLDRPAVALLAAFVGTTRLIDNLLLEGPFP